MNAAKYSAAQARHAEGQAKALIEALERVCLDEDICLGVTDPEGKVYELTWHRDRSGGLARWYFGPVGQGARYTRDQLPMALHLSPVDDSELVRRLRAALLDQIAVAEFALGQAKSVLAPGGCGPRTEWSIVPWG